MRSVIETRRSLLEFILFFLALLFFTDIYFLDNLLFSFEGIFTGLLALTGFIFTARTFITFKLNEVIYGNKKYQNYVEELQEEGAYKKALYDPLRKLDTDLGLVTHMCLFCLLLTLVLSFFPKTTSLSFPSDFNPKYIQEIIFNPENIKKIYENGLIVTVVIQKILSSVVGAYLILTLIKILHSVGSLNRNIKSIIDHWEEDYKSNPKKEKPLS